MDKSGRGFVMVVVHVCLQTFGLMSVVLLNAFEDELCVCLGVGVFLFEECVYCFFEFVLWIHL